MIKIPKKVTFFLMVFMTISLVFSLRNVNWDNLNENFFKELSQPSLYLSLAIFYMLYYVRIIKNEENEK
jgi:predicted lysophospholipase L1 biosynthesis ABC-type transport system permease subunit